MTATDEYFSGYFPDGYLNSYWFQGDANGAAIIETALAAAVQDAVAAVFVALHESAHAQAANGIHTQESVSEGCAAQDTPEASVTPLKPSGSADVWNELEAMYLSLWHKRKVQLELRAAIVVASSAKVTVKLKRKPTKMISSAVTLLQSSVVIERRPVSVTSSQELLDKTISLVEHGHVRLDAAISVSTPVNVSPLVDLNPTSTRVTQELMASN